MISALISALLVILLTLSCSSNVQSNPKQKTMNINLGTDPPSLDPRKCSDNISAHVMTMCFDGLTRLNPNGHTELSLAESCDISEDQTRYTFKIRPVKWSNGDPLTAYDFEESWKRCLDPHFPCHGALAFYYIKNARAAKEGSLPLGDVGIQVLDSTTLQIDLQHPQPYFLQILSSVCYYPYPEKIANHNQSFLEDKQSQFICLGPFVLNDYQPHQKMMFTKNKNYWDCAAVNLETVNLFFVADQSTEISMYEQEEIDWAGAPFSNLPSDAMSFLKKRDDYYSYPIAGLYYYAFNVQKFPLNNPNIRKALTLSINRQSLIRHILQIDATPATRLIPILTKPLPMHGFQDGDIPSAQAYFEKGCKELGLSQDNFPSLAISYNGGISSHYLLAQAIQQEWKQHLGIKSTLDTQEWKVYLDKLSRHDFQIARLGLASLCSDPVFFLELFSEKNRDLNHSGWSNKLFEKILSEIFDSADPQTRLSRIQVAEELFLEEMPIAPLFFYTNAYLKKDKIQHVVLSELGQVDLKWADIQQGK